MLGELTRSDLDALRQGINSRLGELVPDPGDSPHRLHAAIRYSLLSPGKRIRPLLTLLTARSLGGDSRLALEPACAVEMVHAASLVLDDLPCMDNAQTRRGQLTTHVRYGEDVAILTAVALLNHAFAVIGQSPRLEPAASVRMVQALSGAVGLEGLVAGQDHDLRRERSPSLSLLSLINRQKTAVLFQAAVEMGAYVGGANRSQVRAIRRFGLELGLAFQTLDDIIDGVSGEDEGQATVVSLLGMDGARDDARTHLEAARSALQAARLPSDCLASGLDLLIARSEGCP